MNKMGTTLVVAGLIGASAYGCGESMQPPPHPLFLGVAYDVSGSTVQQRLAPLAVGDIDQIVSVLKRRGGILAFGLIDQDSFDPLVRLEIIQKRGRLDERALQNARNEDAVKRFRAVLEPLFAKPRNAARTDINGSMDRFNLFFREPGIPAEADRILLILSDGEDTTRRMRGPSFPGDVTVFAVGMPERTARKLFGTRVALFEDAAAAIHTLNSAPGRPGR